MLRATLPHHMSVAFKTRLQVILRVEMRIINVLFSEDRRLGSLECAGVTGPQSRRMRRLASPALVSLLSQGCLTTTRQHLE